MPDELDRAEVAERLEREAALMRHAFRDLGPIPFCCECEERHVVVTASGARWRFCHDCAADHLRKKCQELGL